MAGLYNFTEDQEMIITTVRDMAKDRIAPRSADIDKNGEYPWDIVELYRESQI